MASDLEPNTIPQLLQRAAESRPHAIACSQRTSAGVWSPTTWMELWCEVQQRAAALQALGLRKGDRLAILSSTCQEWFVAEMAGLLAGAVIMGVEALIPTEQMVFLFEHSKPRGLVVDTQESLARIPRAIRERLQFLLQFKGGRDGSEDAKTMSWQEMKNGTRNNCRLQHVSLDPGDPATLLYTAGTTSASKGILYSHAQVMAGCRSILEAFPQLQAGDAIVCWLPMAHLFQRMMNLMALARGMRMFFVEDPREVLSSVQEVEPAIFTAVPRFYEKLYEGIRCHLAQLSGWRKAMAVMALAAGAKRNSYTESRRKMPWSFRLQYAMLDRIILRRFRRVMGRNIRFLITGTAPMPLWLLSALHSLGWPVLEAYGLSENTIPVAANRLNDYRVGSVGKPMPGNQLRLAEDGEILVKGPGLFTGYYKQMQEQSLFTEEGFYKTGDYGRLDKDGFLFLQGRKADILKTSTGRRIAPTRVEAVYRRSAYVDQVVVFGNGRKHLVALITLNVPAVEHFLARNGWRSVDAEEMARSPVVHDLIRREIDGLGSDLCPHERIHAFAILPRPFSIAEGELTPTLKVRRQSIAARHANRIEQLYQVTKYSERERKVAVTS